VPTGAKKIDEALAEYEAGFAFARQISLPVEDRLEFMPQAKAGLSPYRWFRSPNIICLEKIRQLKRAGKI
jgi:hypothetical protein